MCIRDRDTPASLFNIRARSFANDVAWVFVHLCHHIGVFKLDGVRRGTLRVTRVGGLRCICRVCGLWRRDVMLEEHVVLVCNATNAAEDRASHEVVGVRSKSLASSQLSCSQRMDYR